MMKIIEPLFDIGYLGLVISLGIRLTLEKNKQAKYFGIMSIILGLGDGFHLIPRVISHLTQNGFEKYVSLLSWGQFITSITMTIFYILFFNYYRQISNDNSKIKMYTIYVLAGIRIFLLLLPQNQWGSNGSYLFGIIRNIPFAILGLLLIIWTWNFREKNGLKYTSLLIATSFIFYIPVVLGTNFIPVLGAFMIPKTISYVLLVLVGYRYFIKDFSSKNILNISITFLIIGMIGGVFYREFTKFFSWTGPTNLSLIHVHLLSLGFLFILLIYGLVKGANKPLDILKKPLILFSFGLSWTVSSFAINGIYTISSNGYNLISRSAMSGISGLGHILLASGLVYLLLSIRKLENT